MTLFFNIFQNIFHDNFLIKNGNNNQNYDSLLFNKSCFMITKEKIEKIEKVSKLINKSLKTVIYYDEFIELKSLLNELEIVSKHDFRKRLKRLQFNNEDAMYNAIKKYKMQDPTIRLKINDFLGSLSGSTTRKQIEMIKEYRRCLSYKECSNIGLLN